METNFKCLIVDDEHHAHVVIGTLLKAFSNLTFAKSCYNGEEALIELNSGHYDIVFLDVNMPILNGIDFLTKIYSKPAIVMTTAYTNFAFEAYENDVVDYLQKPISKQRFEKAIQKAEIFAKKRRLELFNTITLKIDGLKQKINQDDILYCQSMGNYTKFFFVDNSKPVLIHETFSSQLNILNDSIFIQIHRTCIVNKLYVASKKDNLLILKNEVELPIGRKYLSMLNTLLMK